ncbi:BrxA/BrxB family bacilliredoxin, partial [Candidatus Woesearchaeota archaeon]|nr:BrxA/BrxB family bacilliredoxin [Candidatus Woesearchaeota archaeon]
MYQDWMTKPLEEELTSIGVKALKTPKDVEKALEEKGTTLLVINSVCGCAAGSARPGVKLALQNKIKPERAVTVFAGVDLDAV